MNLTKKALKQNHEMLWMYEGKKNDLQDLKIYDEHQKLFKKNFEEDSVDYLDRKIINNLYGKTKKQITAIIADEVVDKVQQNIVEVNPDDIVKITKDADRKEAVMKDKLKEIGVKYKEYFDKVAADSKPSAEEAKVEENPAV